MKPMFEQATVIGLGQIGGSVAVNLKRHRFARRVVGVGRSKENLKKAKRMGAVDSWTTDAAKGVEGSDLVVLAAPVLQCVRLAEVIRDHLKGGCLVTDVGSTKESVVKAFARLLPRAVRFVGGHPIAGTEKAGIEAARLDLFKGRRVILVPCRRSTNAAVKKAARLWRRMGAETTLMRPQIHDAILALVSHLPHMVAYALVETVAGQDARDVRRFVGGGFLDFTRVTSSPPEMWRDICLSNRREILAAMRSYGTHWRRLVQMVKRREGRRLMSFFSKAKVFRDRSARGSFS